MLTNYKDECCVAGPSK